MTDWTERTDPDEQLDAFQEWLRETADREDRAPADVLRQVMSTYWILTELTELMDETDYEGMLQPDVTRESGSSADEDSGDHRAIVDVIESIAKMQGAQEPQPAAAGSSTIDPGLIQLIDAIRGGDGASTDGTAVDVEGKYQLAKLSDEIQDLSAELRTIETRTTGLEKTVDDIRSNQSSKSKRLERRMTRVEDELTRKPDTEDLEKVREGVQEQRAELSDRLARTEDRFEDAYAAIKQILEHLLDASDTSEQRMDVLVAALESEIDSLAVAHAEHERVADLKETASKRGITRPVCDGCDDPIELALLERPRCPSCNRPLEGFSTERSFLRTRHVATTRPPRKGEEPTSDLLADFRRHVAEIGEMESEQLSNGLELSE